MFIIYKLTSPSGKIYIGWSSRKLNKRLNDHVNEMRRGSKFKIHNAIRKYGINTFSKEILFETENREDSLLKEQEFIKKYNSIDVGYNISLGGEHGAFGRKQSKTQKELLTLAVMRAHRNGHYDYKKMAEMRKGFKQPESQKIKVREKLSKTYIITTPDGNTETIKNLKEYSISHGLDQGNMVAVSKGRLKQHKGYICKKLNIDGDNHAKI